MPLYLSALEPSADRLGAELMGAISPELRAGISGLGLGRMRALGLRALRPQRPPVMGGVEVVAHLGAALRDRGALLGIPPGSTLVCIDAPDFHVGVARRLRSRGVGTVGLVAPQTWAWRPGRVPAVAEAYDSLLCLFPFEPALYAGTRTRARWVGHPAVDRVVARRPERGVVAVFPGSRPSEVRRHLREFVGGAALAAGGARVVVARAEGIELPGAVDGTRIEAVPAGEAMAIAERAITKSGTVTLELAVHGIPMVVAHRVHPLTYALGRLMVRGVRSLALPNILLGPGTVTEHVQRFDAAALARGLDAALPVPAARLAAALGPPGVGRRCAAILSAESPEEADRHALSAPDAAHA